MFIATLDMLKIGLKLFVTLTLGLRRVVAPSGMMGRRARQEIDNKPEEPRSLCITGVLVVGNQERLIFSSPLLKLCED